MSTASDSRNIFSRNQWLEKLFSWLPRDRVQELRNSFTNVFNQNYKQFLLTPKTIQGETQKCCVGQPLKKNQLTPPDVNHPVLSTNQRQLNTKKPKPWDRAQPELCRVGTSGSGRRATPQPTRSPLTCQNNLLQVPVPLQAPDGWAGGAGAAAFAPQMVSWTEGRGEHIRSLQTCSYSQLELKGPCPRASPGRASSFPGAKGFCPQGALRGLTGGREKPPRWEHP